MRNKTLKLAAIVALGAGATMGYFTPAAASEYPTRPVTLVVPFPAGGPTDVVGRIISQDLSEALGQQVVIENKGGAGGNVGADSVAKADADGYTLLLATAGTHAINASLYPDLPFDHVADFKPVALLARAPNVVVVRPSVEAQSMSELIELAKSRPGELNLAIAGSGTTPHMTAELLMVTAGIDMTLVPYRGGGPAMIDLLGGQVDLMVDNVPTSVPHIQAGSIRALGVTSAERNPALPDVPPVADDLAGFESYAWWGIVAPAGTPDEIVAMLNEKVNRILESDDIKERYDALGATPRPISPEEFGAFISEETEKWADVVERSGAQLQ
jgi:tripartite-type tricarboxylate transporter receptor subunit TctC